MSMTNRFNLKPKFGKPIFDRILADSLSDEISASGWDVAFLLGAAESGTTAKLIVWGSVPVKAIEPLPATTAEPPEPDEYVDHDLWLPIETVDVTFTASATETSPEQLSDSLVQLLLKRVNVEWVRKIRIELVDPSHPVSIWVGGAQSNSIPA